MAVPSGNSLTFEQEVALTLGSQQINSSRFGGVCALESELSGCRPEWSEPSLAYQHLRLRTPRRRPTGGAATAGAGGRTPPGKGKKGKGRPKTSGKKQKLKKPEVDIMSPAAMLNLYYIAHNVADCLYLRGFPWPGAPKGKRGKK
ncbi:small lysine-rich protein 1 [Mus caroli]|uniref:Small lysine-rich protein 1 n=1 Tax=Mus caroli TaxID=10089 RepID=A0A6P5PWP0_MUSCR|nr:small lysine-rich protein 1 [Mus caroli]